MHLKCTSKYVHNSLSNNVQLTLCFCFQVLKDPSVKEPSNTIWHQVLKHADKIGHSGDELEFVQNIVAQVAVIIDIFKTLIKTSCSVAPSNTQSQGKINAAKYFRYHVLLYALSDHAT